MPSDPALPPVIGALATDRDGTALGTVTTVFLDDATERPTWVGLTDGLHAAPDDVPVVVPVTDLTLTEGRLVLPVAAEAVRSAPRVSRADRLSPDEELQLRDHYRGAPGRTSTTGTGGGDAMTRSEEQLQVSTVVEPWTRAVLRIEEVTEEVMVPVTVTRQLARIEHLPLAPRDGDRPDGDAVPAGAERPTGSTGWVTLWAEQPSVTLQRVPVERVRLTTAWVTEETAVTEQLRREEIEVDQTGALPD